MWRCAAVESTAQLLRNVQSEVESRGSGSCTMPNGGSAHVGVYVVEVTRVTVRDVRDSRTPARAHTRIRSDDKPHAQSLVRARSSHTAHTARPHPAALAVLLVCTTLLAFPV